MLYDRMLYCSNKTVFPRSAETGFASYEPTRLKKRMQFRQYDSFVSIRIHLSSAPS